MVRINTFDFDAALPIRFVDDLYEIYLKEKSSVLEILLQNGRDMKPCTNTKYEWLESQLAPLAWTVNAQTIVGSPKAITLVSNAGVTAGMILRFETANGAPVTNLQVIVTAVNINGTDITADLYGATTDNQLNATDVAKLVSNPQPENKKVFNENNDRQPDLEYNYTQIFDDVFGLSSTALESLMYGNTNDITTHLGVSLFKIHSQMAEQMIFGRRVQRAVWVNGSFGGLIQFIDVAAGNVKDMANAPIDQVSINDVLELINADGGECDTLVVWPFQARAISAFNVAWNNPMVSIMDRIAGSYVMKFVGDLPIWPNGMSLNIVVDSKMPKDKIILTNLSRLSLVNFQNRALWLYDATVNGQDGVTAVIRGEYTLVCKDAKYSHGIIKNVG